MSDPRFAEAVRRELHRIRYGMVPCTLVEYRGAVRILELIWADDEMGR